jgi:hypothetical protein
MTFSVIDQPGSLAQNLLDEFWAARIAVLHLSSAANQIMGASQLVEVSVRDSSPGSATSVVPVNLAKFNELITAHNLDPELDNLAGFNNQPVQTSVGSMIGQEYYMPIGSSIMVTEGSAAGKGRVYVPFVTLAAMDYTKGRMYTDTATKVQALWRWFHQLTVESAALATSAPERGVSAVYSRKNNVATQVSSISVKTEFSNLASRRR